LLTSTEIIRETARFSAVTIATLAIFGTIGLTLAVPRMSLLGTEPPFTYADAS